MLKPKPGGCSVLEIDRISLPFGKRGLFLYNCCCYCYYLILFIILGVEKKSWEEMMMSLAFLGE